MENDFAKSLDMVYMKFAGQAWEPIQWHVWDLIWMRAFQQIDGEHRNVILEDLKEVLGGKRF